MGNKASGLLIAAQAEAALTPEQRKYNQLVGKIEKARADLLAWQEGVPHFAQAWAQRMQAPMAELAAQRRQVVLKLAGLLGTSGWSKPERRVMRRALCDLAADLTQNEFIDEAAAAELEALHDQYAETTLDDERRGALADMKGMLAAVAGVDLGDEEFESGEAMMERAQERMREAAQREEGHDTAAQGRRPARKAAAQRKREAQAQEATQSVRDVFRKLVSALHPDRASDAADQARRTALMQRVNQAYAAQDLLGLFALQLEIEQVDPEHLARASTERVRRYNRVLAAQLSELQDETEARAEAFTMEFGIEPWLRLNPRKLLPLLDDQIRQVRVATTQTLHDLRLLDEPAGARRWIKQARREQEADDIDSFGLT